MKHFLKRLAGFSLGPILGAIISLLQVPILTYFLSADEFGLATGFQTLLLTIPNFIYIGIDQAYTREYNHMKDRVHLIQQAMLLPMTLGLVIFVTFIFFGQPISLWLFESPDYAYIVWYAGIWVLAAVVERFILLSIRMEEKAMAYSFYSFALKVGVFAFMLAMLVLGYRDFRVIVYSSIFGQVAVDLYLFVKYRRYLDVRHFSFDAPLVKRMFAFGFPLMIVAALSSALNSVDNVFLTNYRQPFEKGIYGVAMKVAGLIGIIKTAFTSFWVPTAYRWHEEKKDINHYAFISNSLLFILTILFFGILLMKKPIGWLLSTQDEQYRNVQYIIGLLTFPHIMYTLSETTTLGIVFSRKTYYNIYVSLLTFGLSILMNRLLTPSWGYKGAAVASTLSYLMFYLARTYFSSKSGFHFPQRTQLLAVTLLTTAAILNAFDIPYIELWTLALGLLTLLIQRVTFKQAIAIYREPEAWDFT